MAFNLEAKTVIESAMLELSAKQLEELAEAEAALREVLAWDDENPVPGLGDTEERAAQVVAIQPVLQLLGSIASLVNQVGTIKPKRRAPARRKKAVPTRGGPS